MNKAFLTILTVFVAETAAIGAQFRELPLETYLDKVKGGWAGQMIGVAYGAPTEFRACGRIYDEDIPKWTPESIRNALGQDDIYVELSFLEAIEEHGLDITWEQAGRAFAATKFPLWHANKQARENLLAGIMPPESGGTRHNPHWADIDFQIEADLFGLINPGLPRSSADICHVFGRIMNSGDGFYGGLFVAAMYTEAFFEPDVRKIVEFGLTQIPSYSVYARTIRDVIRWHDEKPDDWRATWKKIEEKWASRPSGRCSDKFPGFNIDASLNGAYIVMGLLYGGGDVAKTMEISTRCGQDSDCNPSNAAGILCTALGYSGIPAEFRGTIPQIANDRFAEVKYTWNTLIPACEKFARQNVTRAGGSVTMTRGREVLVIPSQRDSTSH